ncbi:hypothetical protein IY145_02035 [Methylosinus sp. H3A]|uniref:hypothetical protein n=1 Tax=Methylosinus sp. H3A TaxID=2785786 RepID=UPI0018C22C7D|nr:hypothetical protein [Methylosinus sp. H3A]MBG0808188.1 hypothetical protein [Methylosinus sp. H3A]
MFDAVLVISVRLLPPELRGSRRNLPKAVIEVKVFSADLDVQLVGDEMLALVERAEPC